MRFFKAILYILIISFLCIFAFSWVSGFIIGTALYYIEGGVFRLSDLGTMVFCSVVSVLLVSGIVMFFKKLLNLKREL